MFIEFIVFSAKLRRALFCAANYTLKLFDKQGRKVIKLVGFSLVEMLMALLVASLLMVSLAPVITKRFNENVRVSDINGDNSPKIRIYQFDDCTDKGDGTAECKFKVPQNVFMMDIYLQAGGGGGAGATAGVNEDCSLDSISGNTSSNKTICKMTSLYVTTTTSDNGLSVTRKYINAYIMPGMQSYESTVISAGGSGGGAVGRTDCYDDHFKYLTATQNGGKAGCVTKYNGGDTYLGGPAANVGGNSVVNAGENCTAENCCWLGNGTYQTGLAGTCTDTYGTAGTANYVTYSGCKRTACTWSAANNICNNYQGGGVAKGQWKLPTYDQMYAWTQNRNDINYDKGSDGLMLCNDGTAKDGAVNCENGPGTYCNGAIGNECHSYDPWTLMSGTQYPNGWWGGKAGGAGMQTRHGMRMAFSVRCVSTNTSLYGWKSFSGGGGGAGSVLKLYPSSTKFNDYLANHVGYSIHYWIHGPVVGADAAANGATSSKNGDRIGNSTGIHLHSPSGGLDSVLYTINGAYGGKGGALFTQGTGGAKGQNYVSLSGVVSGVDYSITQGTDGSAGTISGGGAGGSLSYTLHDGVARTCVGSGGTVTSGGKDGGTGSCYGGGGGGAASYSSANGKGGQGGGSYIEAFYKIIRKGASGGGGGGGAHLKKLAVQVNPDDEITIIIGKGGQGGIGGSSDANTLKGKDGYPTKVLVNGKQYIAEGGKGGLAGNDDAVTPVSGKGGKGGGGSPSSASITKGKDGNDGSYNTSTQISSGGKGGNSGIGAIGSCGGYYSDGDCSNSSLANAQITNVPPDIVTTGLLTDLKGLTGQGGGGGGFKGQGASASYGNGSNGANGYVMLDWRTYN